MKDEFYEKLVNTAQSLLKGIRKENILNSRTSTFTQRDQFKSTILDSTANKLTRELSWPYKDVFYTFD